MAEPEGVLEWNPVALASALKISLNEVNGYCKDGRRMSFVLERRINAEFVRGKLAGNRAGFDIEDKAKGKWEVRSITIRGVYFNPSNQVGSSRTFNEEEFLAKLADVQGFFLADLESFPEVPFWRVQSKQVLGWWNAGLLTSNTRISRKTALDLIRRLP